jgi:hypothetical protein
MPRSIGQVPRTFGLIGPDRPASKGKNARKGHALHVPGPCKGPPLLRRGQRRRPHRNLEPDFQPRLPHDRNAPCGTEKGTLTPDGIVRLSLGRIEGNLDMPQAPHGQALDTFTGGEHAIGVEADTGPGPDGDVHQVPEVPGQQGFAPGLDAQGATRTPPRAQSGWPGSTRSIPRRTVPPPRPVAMTTLQVAGVGRRQLQDQRPRQPIPHPAPGRPCAARISSTPPWRIRLRSRTTLASGMPSVKRARASSGSRRNSSRQSGSHARRSSHPATTWSCSLALFMAAASRTHPAVHKSSWEGDSGFLHPTETRRIAGRNPASGHRACMTNPGRLKTTLTSPLAILLAAFGMRVTPPCPRPHRLGWSWSRPAQPARPRWIACMARAG